MEIFTVKDFMNLQPVQVQSLLHVTGLRTWYELHQVLCHPITTNFKTPKMITCSRYIKENAYDMAPPSDVDWADNLSDALEQQDTIREKITDNDFEIHFE
jgi:hypothetical protein